MAYTPKSFRKFLATAATTTLVASAIAPTVSAAEFKDVSGNYTEAVNYLVSNDITKGINQESFGVSLQIKRADAAVMIAKALKLDGTNAAQSGFVDVPTRAVEAVNALKEKGIINGKTETTFGSNDPLTRGEMAKILAKAYEITGEDVELAFTDVIGTHYEDAVKAMVANNITNGKTETSFAVSQKITRGEFAIFLHRSELIEDVVVETPETPIETLKSGIAGFVVDGSNPVKNATVTIDGKVATTDQNGYYKILDVDAGTQEVIIEVNGFKTVKEAAVKVLADKVTTLTKDISTFEIDTDAIEVAGVVVDQDSAVAINQADITLEAYNEETKAWETVATVETDSLGKYSIDQTAANSKLGLGSEYRLTVSKEDYKSHVQTLTLDTQEVVNTLSGIRLDSIETIDVTGTVVNANSAKVSGADVTIFDVDGTELATTTTNSNGIYSFEDVKLVTGKYNVVVDDTSSAISYSEFEVVEGTNATHNVQLQAGNTVSASVGTESLSDSFRTGTYTLELLNGKTVIGTDEVEITDPTATALAYDFTRVAPGTYTLKLTGNYVVTKEFTITVDGNESFEGRAVPAGFISGTVTNSEDVAVNKATVNLLDSNGNVVETKETDSLGAYSFTGVAVGKYKVQASGKDLVAETSNELTVTKNTDTTVTAMALDSVVTTGDVAGYVRISGTLAPVENATVTYYDAKGEEVQTATVAANGSYNLTDLDAGAYSVVVRSSGIETFTTTQAITAGDNLTAVNYNVTKGGNASLEITVVDSKGNPINIAANGFDLVDAFVDETSPTVGKWEKATNPTNKVTFENLSEGTYQLDLDFALSTFVDSEATVTVGKGEELKLTIVANEVAAQSDVNFRVVNEANADVTGAYALVSNAEGTIIDVVTTTSGSNTIKLVDGNYSLAVYQNGYEVAERSFTVEGKNVTIPVIQLSVIK